MTKTVQLDTLEGLPGKYLKMMRRHTGLLQSTVYLDDLVRKNPLIEETVQVINDYCLKHHIKGYHYTRAEVAEIEAHGLLCRSGDEIREKFLQRYGSQFTKEELLTIHQCWSSYFKGHQKTGRDNRIFFNTTTVALTNGGADPLLESFGGEQIHMPLNGHDVIMKKLTLIGKPLMVAFRAPGITMTGIGQQYPWGLVALSTYHRIINPEAYIHDVDAFITQPVPPENVLEVCLMQRY